MQLLKKLIEIESELDEKVNNLAIWKLSFQTIMSYLLFQIEWLDLKGESETAMDYASRISYIFKLIKDKSTQHPVVSTTEAMKKFSDNFIEDSKFLISYAHFSLLMPQVRKGTLIVSNIDGNNISLKYASRQTKDAEIIDRLYSYLSLQVIIPYNKTPFLQSWTDKKVEFNDSAISVDDFFVIKEMYEHYYKYFLLVKPLPDSVFEKMTGATYSEYHAFCASVRAFSDFYIELGRANYRAVSLERNSEYDNALMSEYFEWSVCCLNYKSLGWLSGMSNLSIDKFKNILSFYLQIYSNKTKINFAEKSSCGEAFFPPFLLIDESVIFSPQACKYMLTVNNILYSVNKLQKKVFDQQISKHLEPTLICQLKYIFSFMTGTAFTKNVRIPENREIDLIVLSEDENVALAIQVKSTIALDSARTIERVADRVLEGMEQILFFDSLPQASKQNIINSVFQKKLSNTKIINLLVVKSSAGSTKSWEFNADYKIINYALLSWLLASKVEKNELSLHNFENEISKAQEDLLRISNMTEVHDNLSIGKYTINFPNLVCDMSNVLPMNFRSLKYLKKFEDTNC